MNDVLTIRYIPLMQFIGEMLGPEAELVLYDVKKNCVHHVLNPMDEEMIPGSEVRSLERHFLMDKVYEDHDYIVNYRALSRHKHKLKSATFFFKDDTGALNAVLTVNVNVEKLLEVRHLIDIMVSGNQPYDEHGGNSFYDSFDVSVEGMVSSAIREELDRFDVAPNRLSTAEKMDVVRALDHKGIFLVKGAITELADVLKTTETTVYRYLQKLSTE